jgi:hypothetical protein
MRFDTPSFPTSCNSAARRTVAHASDPNSSIVASATAISATPAECRPVYGDFASTTEANASATRSRRSSSATSTRSGGSRAAAAGVSSERQNDSSCSSATSASTRTGSNHVPRRCRAMSQTAARPAPLPEDLGGLG